MQKQNTFEILLVDDDSTDRELFIDAIGSMGSNFSIKEASNGEEALQLMEAAERLPELIILDLNMPVMDGRDTLREIKQHKSFKRIPVCILSTSSAHFDVSNTYDIGANLFLVKPHNFKELIEMLGSLLTLFSKYVTLAEQPYKSS